MKKLVFLFIYFIFFIHSFAQNNQEERNDMLYNKALALSRNLLIVDTHIDLPMRLHHRFEDVTIKTENGHFDLVRAINGGLNAAFMSIYIPAELEEKGGSIELADSLIDIVENLAKSNPQKFAIAVSTDDIKNQFEKGLISLPLGMENGTPINGDINNLIHFYNRGIRYITLAHSKANHICDSSYDPNKKWNGLSPFGKSLILEMNRLGIMVDISHVSDSTFYQVIEISKAPVIASHSSCRFYTPGFERNMNDDMIKKLAEKGGVIQITFGSYFISGDYNKKMTEIDDYLKEHHISRWSSEGIDYVEKFKKENGIDLGSVEDVADHIDHVVRLVGIDYVGLGSDFEGVDHLPENLKSVADYPNLIYELLKRGYSDLDIEKICSGNILRVWKKVEEIANR